MRPETGHHTAGRHLLGPHVVGERVVVRRLIPGERGPSGGPAMTDVLGVCTAWGDGVAVVRREDGQEVAIPISDIVSGKPVPPRALIRHRISPRDLHLHSLPRWPSIVRSDAGTWVLRSLGTTPDGRFIGRANSALAMSDPGLPLDDALARTHEFFTALGRPVWAQVLVDGEIAEALAERGWHPARPGDADVLVQLAAVPRVLRGLAAATAPVALAADETGVRATARIGEVARGCAAVDGDWVGVYDLWTDPARRGEGLARTVLAELLDWAGSRGATTAYLEVSADNEPAVRLYERAGFLTHHVYRYLAAP